MDESSDIVRDSPTPKPSLDKPRSGKGIGPLSLILATSLFIVCFDNNQFWWIVANTIPAAENPRLVALVLFLILFGGLNVTLALSFGKLWLKATAATLLVVSSIVAFYTSQFGVAIDTAIVRSVLETDAREASTLLSGALLWHVALYGILPAVAVLAIPFKPSTRGGDLIRQGALVVASILVPATAIYADYLEMSFYGQANRHVRLFMNPLYPIYATGQYVREILFAKTAARVIPATGLARVYHERPQRPLAVVLVLGETARADHWALNGYDRDTNRYTAAYDIVNFPDVTACGTSTADSLPCIFSPLPRSRFSHTAAAERENMLTIMERLGIEASWLDNSTGCKDLCNDGNFLSVADGQDPTLCDDYGCYDELLVRELSRELSTSRNDTFVVLHQRGSHGPTYHLNVPASMKLYQPECTLDTFRDCDDESLTNAYDNTIAYTDFVLARLIDYLRTLEATHDVAMLYVSDHGESLGEEGLYLHGFPYRLAPDAQKRVPMLLWASDGFYERNHVNRACLEASASQAYSHDWIFHTSLGLMEITADDYDPGLDLLAHCRQSEMLSMASRQRPVGVDVEDATSRTRTP